MNLAHLIYYSRAVLPADSPELPEQLGGILRTSRARNGEEAVTGCLVAEGGWYLQILEGDRKRIFDTYLRILKDPRHRDPLLVELRDIDQRSFPDWMASREAGPEERERVFADLGIAEPFNPALLGPERLVELLMAFGGEGDPYAGGGGPMAPER
jgi:hypothetical protein